MEQLREMEYGARYKAAKKLIDEFIQRHELPNDGSYQCLVPSGMEYRMPDKIRYVTIGGQKVFVSATVNNAKDLMLTLTRGQNRMMEAVKAQLARLDKRTMNPDLFWDIADNLDGLLCIYYGEALRYATLQMQLLEGQFRPLEEIVSQFIRDTDTVCAVAYDQYISSLEQNAANARRYKEQLDRQTDVRIASAPTYTRVQGRIKDGLFGPTFEGTAYTTSSYSQADAIQAYIGNESSARVDKMIKDRHAADQAKWALKELVDRCASVFYQVFTNTLCKNPPTCISAPVLAGTDYYHRPYLLTNISKMLDMVTPEEFFKIRAIVDYYQVDWKDHLSRQIHERMWQHFEANREGAYQGNDLAFMLERNAMKDPAKDRQLHQRFLHRFSNQFDHRYKELLATEKLKIPRGATAEDFFGELLQRVRNCPYLGEKFQAFLENKALDLFEKLKTQRPAGLFCYRKMPKKG